MHSEDNEARGYREPAKRHDVSAPVRRWYIKHGDDEKGPFNAKALARSVRGGALHRTSLVRAENDEYWRPLSSVPALTSVLHKPGPGWSDDPRESELGDGAADEVRTTLGRVLYLVAGVLALASGVMDLSGHNSGIGMILCALGVGVAGRLCMPKRAPRTAREPAGSSQR